MRAGHSPGNRIEMSAVLTDRTRALLALVPDQDVRQQILQLFEAAPALSGPPVAEVLERVRFAVIKLALRAPDGLKIAARLYQIDTRDLLVSAEFATDLTAHEQWCARMLNRSDA